MVARTGNWKQITLFTFITDFKLAEVWKLIFPLTIRHQKQPPPKKKQQQQHQQQKTHICLPLSKIKLFIIPYLKQCLELS